MASEQTDADARRRRPSALGWVTPRCCWCPKLALITMLLCAYGGMGAQASIGLAIMLVIIGFIARVIALVAAQSALELGICTRPKTYQAGWRFIRGRPMRWRCVA